jgi:hypothetical protein
MISNHLNQLLAQHPESVLFVTAEANYGGYINAGLLARTYQSENIIFTKLDKRDDRRYGLWNGEQTKPTGTIQTLTLLQQNNMLFATPFNSQQPEKEKEALIEEMLRFAYEPKRKHSDLSPALEDDRWGILSGKRHGNDDRVLALIIVMAALPILRSQPIYRSICAEHSWTEC